MAAQNFTIAARCSGRLPCPPWVTMSSFAIPASVKVLLNAAVGA